MDSIHHFLHKHPLMLIDVDEEIHDKVVCLGCKHDRVVREKVAPTYKCSVCMFYLHESCSKLPERIQNFSHPCGLVLDIITSYNCNACFEGGFGFSYCCKRCNLYRHVKCALRPTVTSIAKELIRPIIHGHPLTLVDHMQDLEVRCSICQRLCLGSSSSPVYGCKNCDLFLHISCIMKIPPEIDHFFHPSCPLVSQLTNDQFRCHGCDEPGSNLAFSCGKCKFYLDAKCALLPTAKSEDADKIQNPAHQHPLALRESAEVGSEVRCRSCGENCVCPYFVCERCDFFLHKQCAVELRQQIRHQFHPLHRIILSSFPPASYHDTFKCLACGGMDNKFLLVYRCANCDINLHTYCAKPMLAPIMVKYGGHSHFLTFFDKTRAPFTCKICLQFAQNCFFRCVVCEFDIHPYCFPSAPKTIKHKYHIHPLTIERSPFYFELNTPDDPYDSDDEVYCDVCEEKRCKFESVFYCEECRFIAEVRCVISELFPSLGISQDPTTARAVSKVGESSTMEATIANLNNNITELREEKRPLEVEIEKRKAELEALEKKLKPITKRLEELQTDRFLSTFQLTYNMKE